MKSKSKIFTDAEYAALENRINGNNTDKTGIYSSRVKPKIEEIINNWIPKQKILKKLMNNDLNKKER